MGLDYGRPQPLEVKQVGADDWEVSGLLSTFGNVDDGGDVVLPGAFDATLKAGRKVKFLFAHDDTKPLGPPLTLRVTDAGLFATGRISKTALGADVHTWLKDGALDSWSIGYIPTEFDFQDSSAGMIRRLKAVDLLEGSIVAIPMNSAAVVTGVKSAEAVYDVKRARPVHHTATDDGTWDGPANEARLKNDDERAWYDASAWYDATAPDPNGDGKPDRKGDYRFWHHEVSADGTVGAANAKAAQTGIGVLNGGRGGTTIPDSDRAGVYRHLAAHLRDAGLEPPELKGQPFETGDPDTEAREQKLVQDEEAIARAAASTATWDAQADEVVTALESGRVQVRGFMTRVRVHRDVRGKEGRPMSEARRQRLADTHQALTAVLDELAMVLAETAPAPKGYRPRLSLLESYLRAAGAFTDSAEIPA